MLSNANRMQQKKFYVVQEAKNDIEGDCKNFSLITEWISFYIIKKMCLFHIVS